MTCEAPSGLLTSTAVLPADTYKNARGWLMSAFDLTEDQALTLMTVACDFQVHQVVDGNCKCTHSIAQICLDTQQPVFTVSGSPSWHLGALKQICC
jgi:acetamidase/formamidase